MGTGVGADRAGAEEAIEDLSIVTGLMAEYNGMNLEIDPRNG